ncbi:SseB family protein [Kibdelosporangium philippinense]|uniref:SseB family protein n=1 Tax=Kibdelosporangium philippinense TaxID=211113 RepID=A0ABS8ZMZ1_9PSEU|nr:SseB family protein [Kibdelosporangium philippinense]MCE7007991.1 SseB family protein [Kibdelosporangium philippinense]
MGENVALINACRALRAGTGETSYMLSTFRRTTVYAERLDNAIPVRDHPPGEGYWLPVYSSLQEMARSVQTECLYFSLTGADLLDDMVPSMIRAHGRAVAVMLDPLAEHAMALPPVSGIVPDDVAVPGGTR